MQLSRIPSAVRTAMLAVAAWVTGLLFSRLGLPVPWMIGPLVAALLLTLLTKEEWPVPIQFQRLGQALLGLTVGFGFPKDAFETLGDVAVPLVGALLVTAFLSLVNGLILARTTGVDPADAFLGTLPGAASALVGAGSDMGADPRTVAILQYLRLLIVLGVAPVIVDLASLTASPPASMPAVTGSPGTQGWTDLILLAPVGAGGVGLAKLLRIPSPTFLGPCLFSLVLSSVGLLHVEVPVPVLALGTAGIGAWVGSRFDAATLRTMGRVVRVEVLLVLGLIGGSAAAGALFHRITGIDLLTSLLGTSPGAMEAMILQSREVGADTALVVSLHMSRQILLMTVGPWVARLLFHQRRRPGARVM